MIQASLERFLRKAERCRAEATQAISEADRTAWLRMANDWAKLAEQAAPSSKHRAVKKSADVGRALSGPCCQTPASPYDLKVLPFQAIVAGGLRRQENIRT